MYEYQKMKVKEIKEILHSKYNYDLSRYNIKGKTAWVQLLKEAESKNMQDSSNDNNTNNQIIPDIIDPEWNDYVLNLLEPDEKINDNPTTDGLRRLTEKLLGPIVESNSIIVQTPTPENKYRATVQHNITIEFDENDRRQFSGCADSYYGNTDKYEHFPIAVAETRAEGRAYKRALKLRKIIAAEEYSQKKVDIYDSPTQNEITAFQIQFIDSLCRPDKLNLNVQKTVEHILNRSITHITQLTHQEAITINGKLHEYRQNPDQIIEEIKGYQDNWQSIVKE